MIMIRHLPVSLAIVALSLSTARAQDSPSNAHQPTEETFQTVKEEFDQAMKTWEQERKAALALAKNDDERETASSMRGLPNVRFSPRFLAVAAKHPESPDAARALLTALNTSWDPEKGIALPTRAAAIELIRDRYLTKPVMLRFIPSLGGMYDAHANALIADAIARNPDRRVQAAGYREQMAQAAQTVLVAERFDPSKRAEGEKARIEVEKFKKLLREKYGDLVADLSVGQLAPEVQVESLAGKPASVLALRGKVVVLDIWATWCGPCKGMIPHEREMVERLKDKPFVLVSISIDENKKTLTDFLAKESMPWTHWWCGNERRIVEEWNVRTVPGIYVLDVHGIIRYSGLLYGEALEKAVNVLLAEQTKPKVVGASN